MPTVSLYQEVFTHKNPDEARERGVPAFIAPQPICDSAHKSLWPDDGEGIEVHPDPASRQKGVCFQVCGADTGRD